jgi:thiamine pyrophosphate-dependent acetolactate synthase large subunit-like protein
MVDVIKTLDIEYCPSNAASSFRGLHESLNNYGGNKKPEFLTVMHEESGVAMGHGYFKITGKPMMTLCHGTVGLQHASMAVYNAWCDRVPVIVVGGNDLDAAKRPPGVPTFHSAQDINALVRDYTKWDDTPVSLQHFAQSFVRAYKYAMTPPYGPVAISLDAGIQQEPIQNGERLYIPRYVPTSPPQGEMGAVREAAKLLANAERPVIVVDRAARNQDGVHLLVQLAEALQAPVIDQQGRMNFPRTHYLNQSARGAALIQQADVVIGLELSDYWATVNQWIDNGEEHGHGIREQRIKDGTKLISISSVDLNTKANYQDFQRFQTIDVQMAGDAQATLPSLIEAVKSAIPNDRKDSIAKRGEAFRKGLDRDAGSHPRCRGTRLGRQPDQHGSDGYGAVGPDQGPGLVAGCLGGQCQQLAAAALADGEALPLARSFGRIRGRIRRARFCWRRPRQPPARSFLRQHPIGRRSDVRAGRAVDCCASQDSAAFGHAQQPRLSSGSHARSAHVKPAQPRRSIGQDHRADWDQHRGAGYRFR